MADREDNDPGLLTIRGADLLQQARELAEDDGRPWDAIAKAAAYLRRAGYIEWQFDPYPNGPPEPRPEFIEQTVFQQIREIGVTAQGRAELARRRANDSGNQISIVNSTVGQIALGDIKNIDIFVILNAMERSLENIDATEPEKEQARTAIQRMRDAGGTVATSAVGGVLGAALRQALGLP